MKNLQNAKCLEVLG